MRSSSRILATALGAAAAWLASAASTLAASPSPSPSPAAVGDPRSSGQGPGFVGDPLLAIGLVVLIGLAALGVTLLYVRVSGGQRDA